MDNLRVNDGCVVARSAEAKALGIQMGVPWFRIKAQAARAGIIPKSSNYALYADMSNRVVQVLRDLSPRIQVYSIDESFLDLSGISNPKEHGHLIRERVHQWVGLPVCVGIAQTKTLAKLANHVAKTRPQFEGVCDLANMDAEAVTLLLHELDVGDVWGVGRKFRKNLQALGIHTVAGLRAADTCMLRRRFGVVLERTVQELRGVSCLALNEIASSKQQIICSRSFGRPVTTYHELGEAIASYVGRAGEKLRAEENQTSSLTIWIESNFYNSDLPQNSQSLTVPLPAASSDTRQLVRVALWMLKRIYRDGIQYRKAGCMLSAITPRAGMQHALFNPSESGKVMVVMDHINARFGRGTLQLAAEGIKKAWQMKRGHISPRYTTDWDEVMVVR